MGKVIHYSLYFLIEIVIYFLVLLCLFNWWVSLLSAIVIAAVRYMFIKKLNKVKIGVQ